MLEDCIEIHSEWHELNFLTVLVERPILNLHHEGRPVLGMVPRLCNILNKSSDVEELVVLEAAAASDSGCWRRLYSTVWGCNDKGHRGF